MGINHNPANTGQIVDDYVNTAYDTVKVVSDNIDALVKLAGLTGSHQASDSEPTTRPDGSPLESGDTYFNTTTSVTYTWNDTSDSWVAMTDTAVVAETVTVDATMANTGTITLVNSYAVGDSGINVFVQGVFQTSGVDYTETDAHTLDFGADILEEGELISVVIGTILTVSSLGALTHETLFTTTASQAAGTTGFTVPVSIRPSKKSDLNVYIQGAKQASTAYNYDSVTGIVTFAGEYPEEGDEVQIINGTLINSVDVATADDVEYTPTGGVATTVADKLGEFVSVKDFGAAGDGVTNDYDAIQDAIDAVIANGGGTVFFPTGTYKTEAMLSCNPAGYAGKGVILKGEFYESIIQPVLSSTYALECRADGGHSKVIIDGIFLDGSNCTGTASGLFMHRNHNGSGASDLFIYNFPDYGLHISENWTMNFYNVEIRNCDVGLKIYADNTYGDVAAGNINNIAFYGCSFAANNYGIDIGDVNYRTTYPLAGSYPFQNLGFYNCNISNVVRGIRSYYTIGMNLQNPYLEAQGTHDPATFIHLELVGCDGTEINHPYLSSGRNYLSITECLNITVSNFTSLSALTADEVMFNVTDSELTLKNGRIASGGLGTFFKYTQTTGKNVKLLFEFMNYSSGFTTKIDETFVASSNTRIGFKHCKSLGIADIDSALQRTWEISENADMKVWTRDVVLSDKSTGAGTTANGTIEVRIGGTTYYLLTSASA